MKIFFNIIIAFLLIINVFADKIVDKMESTSGWGPFLNEDAEATLTTIDGVNGKAVNVEYKLKTGSYVIIEKEFKAIDLSGWDFIKFQVKASGNKNTLKIIVKDVDDEEYDCLWDSVSNTSFQWFETGLITNVPNQKIKFLKFELNPNGPADEGGSGSVTIGPVGLYRSTSQTASTQMVDDFDDNNDATNLLGFTNTYWFGDSAGNETLIMMDSGSNYLTLKFTKDTSGSPSGDVAWITRFTTNNIITGQPGLDISDKDFLRFRIKGKDGDEKIGIKCQDTSYAGDVVTLEELGFNITTLWQWIEIDLSDAKLGNYNRNRLFQLLFLFVQSSKPSLGQADITIYMEDIQFYSPAKTAGLVEPIIDSMDRPLGQASPWIKAGNTFGSEENKTDSVIDVNIVDTEIGKATKIDYSFNDGVWVVIERYFALNFFAHSAFKFDFKGDGQNNDLEVKFTDDDSTVYKKKFYNFTDTDDKWRLMQIQPVKDLAIESSGTDDNLDLKNIVKIAFAVTKNDGGNGDIAIDNITLGDYSPEIDTKGKKIIVNLKISPNPFSPNDDSFEDELNFIYLLKKEARIKVLIYDLKGNLIQKLETANPMPPAVEQTITWTGKDYANKLSKNGIYFIKFYAQATDGEKEDIKSIISVLK